MSVTITQVKRLILDYLSQSKPEPNLVMSLGDSIMIETVDWLKKVGAKSMNEFWVLSRANAKKALSPSQFDWDMHWAKEAERTLKEVERASHVKG